MRILCSKCKGKGRLGNLVCPLCWGKRFVTSGPRTPTEKSDPVQRDLRASAYGDSGLGAASNEAT